MSQHTLLSRKLTDIDAAVATMSRMDISQFDVKARAPDLYDETVHLAALTLALQTTYTRLESVLKDILSMTGENVPAGTSWHRDLLLLAATPAPGLRAAIISETTQLDLKSLLAFRHAARNAYADELRSTDVRRNVESAVVTIPRATSEVRGFVGSFFGG
jgi:hypothetical protein